MIESSGERAKPSVAVSVYAATDVYGQDHETPCARADAQTLVATDSELKGTGWGIVAHGARGRLAAVALIVITIDLAQEHGHRRHREWRPRHSAAFPKSAIQVTLASRPSASSCRPQRRSTRWRWRLTTRTTRHSLTGPRAPDDAARTGGNRSWSRS